MKNKEGKKEGKTKKRPEAASCIESFEAAMPLKNYLAAFAFSPLYANESRDL